MRSLSVFAGLALILALTLPAFAQTGPSFDCAKAESTAEQLICEDAELARLDNLIADRYAAALSTIRTSGDADAEKQLRTYQRGWIKGRDTCWSASDPKDCITTAYLLQEGTLVARWMLEEPTGTAFWACNGNPANEIVTMYFDTELPSVRLERGDDVSTGSLVKTASGARYEGDFGRSIWVKGDEATYRAPDPDGSTIDCVLVDKP